MPLTDLGVEYTPSLLQGGGTITFIEHFAGGETQEFTLDNIYPFTSIADVKRMIWVSIGGQKSYSPKFVFLAYETTETRYAPLEYHWGSDSGIPATLLDPIDGRVYMKRNPELVDDAGNRRAISPRMTLHITLEDSLKGNKMDPTNITIHVWRLNQLVQDPIALTSILFDGFIRLYYPWLQDLSVLDDALSEEINTDDEAYAASQIYIENRQSRLDAANEVLEAYKGDLGTIAVRGVKYLRAQLPAFVEKPESLEVLFYELALSERMPYLRFFPNRGGQEPILRLLKTATISPETLNRWIQERHVINGSLIIGKVLIRSTRAPEGIAFNLRIFEDGSADLELSAGNKDVSIPGTIVDDGLITVEHFMESLPFVREALSLRNMHAIFTWEHPEHTSSKPTQKELRDRLSCFTPLFDEEPTEGERGVYILRYRALSNYESENEIFRFLSRIVSREVSVDEYDSADTAGLFVDRIKRKFGRSTAEATRDFQQWLERQGKYQTTAQGAIEEAVPAHHDGIIVRIRNNHPNYEIEIENIRDASSVRRILTSLAVMLRAPIDRIQCDASTTNIAENARGILEADDENRIEASGAADEDYTRATTGVGGEVEDLDWMGMLNSEEGVEEEYELEGGVPLTPEPAMGAVSNTRLTTIEPETIASRAPAGPGTHAPPPIPAEKRRGCDFRPILPTNSPEPDVSEFYIERLKYHDTELFGYPKKSPNVKLYSRACQRTPGKQPNSMSPAAYARVKECYKDKVTFLEGPQKPGWKLPEGMNWYRDHKNNRPVWVVIKTGSPGKKNYYMCAVYWCVRDDLPLIEEEFEERGGCPFCGGTAITNPKSPQKGETVLKRPSPHGVNRIVGYQDPPSKHPDGFPLPCCSLRGKDTDLIDWSEPPEEETRAAILTGGPDIADEIGSEDVSYHAEIAPGRKAPMPRIEIKRILETMQTKYVLSADKYPLLPGKIGVVPKQVDALFGQDSSHAITKKGVQQSLTREALVFVRIGIQNTQLKAGDRFLSLLSFYLGTNDVEAAVTAMGSPAFVRAFEGANYGTLLHEFSRPDQTDDDIPVGEFQKFASDMGFTLPTQRAHAMRLFKAYMNFMSYIRNPSIAKDIRYFEHILMTPRAFISNGLILFRIIRDPQSEDWSIQCPAFGIPPSAVLKNAFVAFVIHDPKFHIWEPLVLYRGEKEGIVFFNPALPQLRELNPSVKKSLDEWLKILQAPSVGCGRAAPPPHAWLPDHDYLQIPSCAAVSRAIPGFTPSTLVRDRSNRFVGLIFRANTQPEQQNTQSFFVPALDDGTLLVTLRRVYESTSLPEPTMDDTLAFYMGGVKEVKTGISQYNPALTPVGVLIRDGKYVGLRLKCNALIPIKHIDIGTTFNHPAADKLLGRQETMDRFPWEIDEMILPLEAPAEGESLDLQTAEDLLTEAYQHLRLTLALFFKRDQLGEAILRNLASVWAAKQLPLYERRRRADMILEPLVKSWILISPFTDELEMLPRIRKDCTQVTEQNDCKGICRWSDGRCLIHVPSTNRYPDPTRVLTARLSDEMLRNHLRREEVLQGRTARIRPMKGNEETLNEIFLASDPAGYVTRLKEQQAKKIQKTKYTHAYTFAEESSLGFVQLVSAIAGLAPTSVEAEGLRTRIDAANLGADTTQIPDEWKRMGYSTMEFSPEITDKFLTAFVELSKFPVAKTLKMMNTLLKDNGAPADVVAGGYRGGSIYDLWALGALRNSAIAVTETGIDGRGKVLYFIKPKTKQFTATNARIIVVWGPEKEILRKESRYIHPFEELPPSLVQELDRATVIQTLDQIETPAPIATVTTAGPIVTSFEAAAVPVMAADEVESYEPLQTAEDVSVPLVNSSIEIIPPVEMPVVAAPLEETRIPFDAPVDEIAVPAAPELLPAEHEVPVPPEVLGLDELLGPEED